MNLDWKHLAAGILGAGLAALLSFAASKGIEIPCPAQPSAVIQSK